MDEQKSEKTVSPAAPQAGSSNHEGAGMSPEKRRMLIAALAYLLFFVPLITGDSKKDEFVKYHTKQGFALFIVALAVAVVQNIFAFIFWFLIGPLLNLAILVLLVIGIVNVFGGKKQPLPVIGHLGDWLKI